MMTHREARQLEQQLGKFHVGHLPIGTVIEFESPTNGHIPKEQRQHPEEMYGRSTATVAGITSNGPDSWLAELVSKSELTGDLDYINFAWIRRIVSRGTGKLTVEDQATVDKIRAEYAQSAGKVFTEDAQMRIIFKAGHRSTYNVAWVSDLVTFYLNHHPAYKNVSSDHLIRRDLITKFILSRVGVKDKHNHSFVINKRKFAKIFKAAYQHSRISRRKSQAEENRELAEIYARDWETQDY